MFKSIREVGKFFLFAALAAPAGTITSLGGVTGIVRSVDREDGSGSSFNVSMYVNNRAVTVYVRTID